jgi:hypothetical protein
MKKADLLAVAQHLLGTVPYNRIPLLAKRHKVEADKSSTASVELLQKHVAALSAKSWAFVDTTATRSAS